MWDCILALKFSSIRTVLRWFDFWSGRLNLIPLSKHLLLFSVFTVLSLWRHPVLLWDSFPYAQMLEMLAQFISLEFQCKYSSPKWPLIQIWKTNGACTSELKRMFYSENRRHVHIYNTDTAQCQRGHQPWVSEANISAKSQRHFSICCWLLVNKTNPVSLNRSDIILIQKAFFYSDAQKFQQVKIFGRKWIFGFGGQKSLTDGNI